MQLHWTVTTQVGGAAYSAKGETHEAAENALKEKVKGVYDRIVTSHIRQSEQIQKLGPWLGVYEEEKALE